VTGDRGQGKGKREKGKRESWSLSFYHQSMTKKEKDTSPIP